MQHKYFWFENNIFKSQINMNLSKKTKLNINYFFKCELTNQKKGIGTAFRDNLPETLLPSEAFYVAWRNRI